MTQPLTYTSNAHEVLEAILNKLFAYEIERQLDCVTSIAHAAGVFTSFMHKGITFRPRGAVKAQRTSLPESAWPDMEKHLLDKNNLDEDSKAFWQILFPMIVQCQSLQDVRDTLPEFIVEIIPELSVLPRLREELFLMEEPRHKRQFAKIKDKMELYVYLIKNPSVGKLMSLHHFEV